MKTITMTVKQLLKKDFYEMYDQGYDFPTDSIEVLEALDSKFVVELEQNLYTGETYPMTNIW